MHVSPNLSAVACSIAVLRRGAALLQGDHDGHPFAHGWRQVTAFQVVRDMDTPTLTFTLSLNSNPTAPFVHTIILTMTLALSQWP
eukprot:6188855-Pleurochrysis_carterae.AAC.1